MNARFSIIVRQDRRVRASQSQTEAIREQAWQPTPYWLSTSEAPGVDIADMPFTVFAGDNRHARYWCYPA